MELVEIQLLALLSHSRSLLLADASPARLPEASHRLAGCGPFRDLSKPRGAEWRSATTAALLATADAADSREMEEDRLEDPDRTCRARPTEGESAAGDYMVSDPAGDDTSRERLRALRSLRSKHMERENKAGN